MKARNLMNIVVRPAVPADWPWISSILLERDRNVDSLAAAHQRYLRRIDSTLSCVLVAMNNDDFVGFAMAQQWDEYLMSGRKQIRFSTLEVLPAHQRQGVGRALFEGIVGWAEDIGATWLEWYASPSAVPFYERLGFKGDPCPQPEYPYFEIHFSKAPVE